MRLTEAAQRLVTFAEALRARRADELSKRHPRYPLVGTSDLADPTLDEKKRLKEFLATLPDDQVFALAAMMYIGRGDFGTAGFPHSMDEMRKTFDTPVRAAAQMAEKAPLADYLSDGIAALADAGINIDGLIDAEAMHR